jgi:hypothetical protein
MIKLILSTFGAIIGGAIGYGAHHLTWRLRLNNRSFTLGLGLVGALLFTALMVQLFSPYLGIPLIYPLLLLGFVLAAVTFLAISQSRRFQMPLLITFAAQFANVLLAILLVLASTILRDWLISLLYPKYGETAFALIYSFQSWLAIALILGLLAAEVVRSLFGEFSLLQK